MKLTKLPTALFSTALLVSMAGFLSVARAQTPLYFDCVNPQQSVRHKFPRGAAHPNSCVTPPGGGVVLCLPGPGQGCGGDDVSAGHTVYIIPSLDLKTPPKLLPPPIRAADGSHADPLGGANSLADAPKFIAPTVTPVCKPTCNVLSITSGRSDSDDGAGGLTRFTLEID